MATHRAALDALLGLARRWVHALEWNGLRSRRENAAVTELAARWGKPGVSGGDRHGTEPNANLNLTDAETFAEFAAEIRTGVSRVLFLPQYHEPLRLRWIKTVKDILRFYPQAAEGRRHWTGRFLYRDPDGSLRPVAEVWNSRHAPVFEPVVAALQLSGWRRLRPAMRLALADAEH